MLCDSEQTGGSQAVAGSKGRRGMLASPSECLDCRSCLRDCPLPKAIAAGAAGKTAPAPGCIDCGVCLRNCPQQAIDYRDDLELFLADLARGTPVSLLVAPAVRRHFSDYRQVFGFLHSLGVKKFYNVLLRADITIWAYVRILGGAYGKPFISSPCAAVTNYILNYAPALRPHLMPVYSPLVCSAVFLQKYRQLEDELAFLSPCIAKRAEIRQSGGKVRYSVTIGKLKQYLTERAIDLSRYEAVDFADGSEGQGVTLGTGQSVCSSLKKHLPDRRFRKISGNELVYRYLTEYEAALRAGGSLPDLLEVYNCAAGCDSGTGTGGLSPGPPPARLENNGWQQEVAAAFHYFNNTLDLADFVWPEIAKDRRGM
ncbi:hydrogenase assembly protein HupF|uniref:Iron only hydrogenase large subunit, C-terminal domain n=1 Tax=Dendrosporobacter quercicolus TaxID=146817 RepID=A0A1G9XHP6_9FIRM|nr:[Fe-Fe] hydrogenase large subunit C-terminal domain-containing protein [Dendrosporobacter quercicolus]NSL49658.1 hydrogenase assembly protein HupF [Dendrosporobacter quercicolus DSM 1736]SDM96362.1 Iron only hydrogenase large subunit, C-terminal domain [Dendrosporobacter quercicolus]